MTARGWADLPAPHLARSLHDLSHGQGVRRPTRDDVSPLPTSQTPEQDSDGWIEFREEALAHLDALYGLALRLSGGDEARAEELVRETMIEACRNRDGFEPATSGRAWLTTILRNTFVGDLTRRTSRRSRVGPDEVEEPSVYENVRETDAEGAFFERIADEEVVRAVDGLPTELRVPLVLSDLEGLGYREIADTLGIPVGAVESRLQRARRRLQRTLYDHARGTGNVS